MQRRKPFNRGSKTERINAVGALGLALETYPMLAAVKDDVNAYHTQLETALNTQEGNISGTGSSSLSVEELRIALCNAMFYVYGGLLQMYFATPDALSNFIDVSLMQQKLQTEFTHIVKANKIYTIVKRTLPADAIITIINTGNTNLKFYLSETRNGAPSNIFVPVPPQGQIPPTAITAFGNPATMHYLIVENTDAFDGSFDLNIE